MGMGTHCRTLIPGAKLQLSHKEKNLKLGDISKNGTPIKVGFHSLKQPPNSGGKNALGNMHSKYTKKN
jgi:hypothetical protein